MAGSATWPADVASGVREASISTVLVASSGPAKVFANEAAEQLRGPSPPPIGRLAAELGYCDQSHFVRDFKAVVGCAPHPFARGS